MVTTAREPVPVEFRFLGLDKRTFTGALIVVAVFLLFTVVVPRVNDAIPWKDPVAAGEELAVTKDIAFAPITGWNVIAGHRLNADGTVDQTGDVTVTNGGVVLEITSGPFDGTPAALLAQVEHVTDETGDPTFRVDGQVTTVTAHTDQAGVMQSYSTVNTDGTIAVFVVNGTGVKVDVHGSPAQMRATAGQIAQMISSLRTITPKVAS